MNPTERLAKIAQIVEAADERRGAVYLTDAEVLGIYLLAVTVPKRFDRDALSRAMGEPRVSLR